MVDLGRRRTDLHRAIAAVFGSLDQKPRDTGLSTSVKRGASEGNSFLVLGLRWFGKLNQHLRPFQIVQLVEKCLRVFFEIIAPPAFRPPVPDPPALARYGFRNIT